MKTMKRLYTGYITLHGYIKYVVFQLLFNVPIYLVPAIIGAISGALIDSIPSGDQGMRRRLQLLLIGGTLLAVGCTALRTQYMNRTAVYLQKSMRERMLAHLIRIRVDMLGSISNVKSCDKCCTEFGVKSPTKLHGRLVWYATAWHSFS